jgi:hypothetical protein
MISALRAQEQYRGLARVFQNIEADIKIGRKLNDGGDLLAT